MKSVLIVEDSSLVREIAARIVKELGLKPIEAATPAEAIEIFKAQTPPAILLDWDLPNFGALDVLHGVGVLTPEPRPSIILLATENDPQQFTLARAAGAQFHILKPFERQTIAAALAEAGVLEGAPSRSDRAAS